MENKSKKDLFKELHRRMISILKAERLANRRYDEHSSMSYIYWGKGDTARLVLSYLKDLRRSDL